MIRTVLSRWRKTVRARLLHGVFATWCAQPAPSPLALAVGLTKVRLGQAAWDVECAERVALVYHAGEGRGDGGAGCCARRGGGDQRQAGRRAAAGALPLEFQSDAQCLCG